MKLLALDDVESVFGTVDPPAQIQNLTSRGGGGGISFFLNRTIELIYVFAAVLVVFMFVIGAFEMITSGGDKEKVASARKRITYALIGATLMAVTFLILRVLGEILNFKFFVI